MGASLYGGKTIKNYLFSSRIALLCLILYSLRADVVNCEQSGGVGGTVGGGGRTRQNVMAMGVAGGRGTSQSSPAPVWRRRIIHRRPSTSLTTTTEASVETSFSSPSGPSSFSSPSAPSFSSPSGPSSFSSPSGPSSPSAPDNTPILPDDFINLASNSAGLSNEVPPSTSPRSSFFPTTGTQQIFADPFMLVGDDNILGPTPNPRRRKVFRRTRRRRIKKLRGPSSTQEPASISQTTEEVTQEEDFGGSAMASSTKPLSTEDLNKFKYLTTVGSSTRKPSRLPSSPSTTMKLEVIPIDSIMQSITTEEVSTEGGGLSALTTGPTAAPTGISGMNNIKPGFYTRHQKGGGGGKKRAKSKENIWKATDPNFSVELFDNTDATDEQPDSNVLKRESSSSSITSPSGSSSGRYNMFTAPSPTAFVGGLENGGDQSTDESIQNPYVNVSRPIDTELHNSLQFTLQGLHPLLNSESVLSSNNPRIPENKTVAITHSLADTVQDTPVAPDLRFLPAHLRKSHPLLSQESFFGGGLGSSGQWSGGLKLGPRINVNKGTSTTSTTTTSTERNRGRFSTSYKSTTSTTVPSTSTTSRKTTSTTTSEATSPSSTSTVGKVSPTPSTPPNVHLESLGNLRITEIVYPTNTAILQQGGGHQVGGHMDIMKGYQAPPPRPSTTTIKSTTTSGTTSTTRGTTSTTRGTTSTTLSTTTGKAPSSSSSSPSSTSRRPAPIFDHSDHRSPPLILMGSDSSLSSTSTEMGSNIESPPAFDDMLLEELMKGFDPPKPSTTSTTTTTTTTTTTPRPTTRTTTTTTTTTTTPPPPPPPPPPQQLPPTPALSPQDDETQQLIQLLNLLNLQQLSSTTEGISTTTTGTTSTSSSTIPSTSSSSTTAFNPSAVKLDDDFLKNLALLENLLSPTAKTMIKEAVDTGTTEKIKNPSPSGAGGQPGLSNSDLHQIFQLLDAMSTTTTPKPRPPPTTPTPPQQVIHPALQNVLSMLGGGGGGQGQLLQQSLQKPLFSIPEPPKPVPTTSSFDLLSQIFNLNAANQQTERPKTTTPGFGSVLGGLFESFMPKKTPANRDANGVGSNPLLSYFQAPSEPASTPAPGPYYWFDVNAFLGQDPTAGAMSGIRPKFGQRDYFVKVRRRRNSMEMKERW